MTPTEYDLLRALVTYAGKVLTHRQLLRQVWGAGYEGETHLLRVNMSNLRHKLEPDSDPSLLYSNRTWGGIPPTCHRGLAGRMPFKLCGDS